LSVVTSARTHLDDLAAFVAASPSSFHVATESARRLRAAGFAEQDETAAWDASPGGHFLVRDGALVAWRIPGDATARTGFRIIGAHTDSPTFKLKPNPDLGRLGWAQVGMEIYGSPLLNSWLDRELGLAGRLALLDGTVALVQTGPIMRIPQLAIHLDRGVNDAGLKLDKQQHTVPIWGVGHSTVPLLEHLADAAGCDPADIAGTDLVAFDTAPPAVFGPTEEFFASARMDNLSSVHAGLTALIRQTNGAAISLLAAFDHEEIGSGSRSGAAGPLLADVLERTSAGLGASRDDQHRALAQSRCFSADAGHAVHPNYPERHDPAHHPLLNGGPLLKINANQRYASDARGAGSWRRACRQAGVETQEFVSSNNLPCGSTIGPLTATRLGISTVDVGIPLLSMHSAREMAGADDPYALSLALAAALTLES
jgi:aspartyl aminopeptidase